jgi:hypothetical protein
MKDIELKVEALITALHDQLGLAADELAALATVKETARPTVARNVEKDLLNGPQNGQNAKSQDEIDRLFGKCVHRVSQVGVPVGHSSLHRTAVDQDGSMRGGA